MSIFGFLQSLFGSKNSQVHFENIGKFDVEKDTSILEAALQNKVDLEHYCGGCCSCSTCRVEVIEGQNNLSLPEDNERSVLGEKRLNNGSRLACQTKIRGPVKVRIPDLF